MPAGELILKGVGASPGVAMGRALCVARHTVQLAYRRLSDPQELLREEARLTAAMDSAQAELKLAAQSLANQSADYTYIIEAHQAILRDRRLSQRTLDLIKQQQINAEWALTQALGEARRIFDRVDDPYIRARFGDVQYVVDLVMRYLSGQEATTLSDIREKVIVVAHDLSPAETIQMDLDWVLGFATDMGGPTSHTAIMAQAKALPAVVGLERISLEVSSGDFIILDGQRGEVVINPTEETLAFYSEREEAYGRYAAEVLAQAHLPAETPDGFRVEVGANIEMAEEVESVLQYGAECIGLYRTEYFYVARKELPSEELLFAEFVKVVQRLQGRTVNIRTLDVGGDKLAFGLASTPELNPAMGLRAIRFTFRERDLFKDQLRAALRASAFGKTRLMFPLISGVNEILLAKEILAEAKAELEARGQEYDRDIEVGIMMEVPSAVAVADLLAREVDFFSIGTNDLIQYSLAIDRVNEHVAHMYQPFHPAVLRMIRQVIQAGQEAGITVAMCGEMAGDIRAVPLLMGLGLHDLSMNAVAVPGVKLVVRSISHRFCRRLAKETMRFRLASEVTGFLEHELAGELPQIYRRGA